MNIFIVMATGLALAFAASGRAAVQDLGRPTAVFVDPPIIDGPEVAINRRPATVIKPPVKGDGWLATTACCTPNLHRDLRIVVDGRRIETAETFAVDWALLRATGCMRGRAPRTSSSTPTEQMCSRSPMGPSSPSRTAS